MATTLIDKLFKVPVDKANLFYSHDAPIIEKYWTIKPGDVCFDIGFGPGRWTLYSLAKGAHTYSFDPKPYSVSLLLEFMKLNDFNGQVYQFGLWNNTEHLLMGKNSSFKDVQSSQGLEGEFFVTTLDSFCNRSPYSGGSVINRLDFINIDAEASELEILQGGRQTIAKFAPTIVMEVHVGVSEIALRSELQALHPYEFISDKGFLIAKSRKVRG